MDIEHPKRFAASAPDRPAVIIGDRVLSYGELERRSNQVAQALRSSGLGVGSHLAVLMENRTEYFEVVWAALRAGLLVTPINWHLSAAEAGYIVSDCGAAALVVSAPRADVAAGIDAPALKVRLAVGGPVEGFDSYEEVTGAQPASPVDDECEGNWMFYSSGTTGRPKGITPASVGGPVGAGDQFTGMVRFLYGADESTRYLSPAPLYHAAPLAWATAVHRIGGTVIATERFDALEFLRLVERHRVTLSQVVPTHLVRLLKLPAADRARFDLSSLRTLVHAAAPCPPEVKRAVLDWLGPVVYEYYSGSEGVGFCAIGPEEWLAPRARSAGRCWPRCTSSTGTATRCRRAPRAGCTSRWLGRSHTTVTRSGRPARSTNAGGAPSARSAGWTRTATSTSPTGCRT